MALLQNLVAGVRRLLRPNRAERDLDDEVRHFVDMAADERMRAGMGRSAAYRAARIELGGVAQVKEQVRTAGWEARLGSVWQDVRYGARGLRRDPGFTLVALVTLALGIGANTAMFSVVNGVILKPLPYHDSGSLVLLWSDDVRRGLHESPSGIPTIDAWRGDQAHLSGLAIYRGNSATVTAAGADPERLRTAFVEPAIFQLLGVPPASGRFFTEPENAPGTNVAIVTASYASRHFGGEAIGKTILIDGDMNSWKQDPRTVRVVGVLPEGFYFPSKDVPIYEPLRMYWRYANESIDRDDYFVWSAVARLAPGISAREASASLTRIGVGLAAQYPVPKSPSFPGYAVNAVPVLDEIAGTSLRSALWVLLAVVGVVLMIACVNVANLLLARGAAREREFGVRLALGAGRRRILRQLLVEHTLLGILGGALGVGVAVLAMPALAALAPASIPRLDELSVDARVLGFAIALSVASVLIFGFGPAWRAAARAPGQAIKGARTWIRRGWRTSAVLIVAECALAVVLVAGAGLLIRSFARVLSVDPGFRPSNLLVLRISPPQQPPAGLRGVAVFQRQERRIEEMLATVMTVHGVRSAGLAGELMISADPSETITFAGQPFQQNAANGTPVDSIGVSPGFFETIGAHLITGRLPTVDDARFSPTLLYTSETVDYTGRAEAAVVNQAFVRAYLGNRDPIGVRFYEGHPGKPFFYEIVGVVADMRRQGLETEPAPQYFGRALGGGGDLVIRTDGDPLAVAAGVRAALRAFEPAMVIVRMTTGDDSLGTFEAQRRFQTLLLALFAALALVLASVGIFGVMGHTVEQRTREVGVRMALGASRLSIAALVIRQGLLLAAAGVAAGLVGAWFLTGLLSHWLVGITATDPVTFGVTIAALLGAAALACWLPARRAARVDPIRALRTD